MADGNMGSLFVSLGIKDEMSKTIRKIVNEMNGVDEATNKAKKRGEELVKSLNNVNAGNFSKIFRDANRYIEENARGISGIISLLKSADSNNRNILTGKFLEAKNLNEVASMLNTINSELAKEAKLAKEAAKNNPDAKAKKDNTALWQARISNALEYIRILQDINLLQNKISATKSDNPNVNTKRLEEARRTAEAFKAEITKALSFDGVDDSKVLSGFVKTFKGISKQVNDILANFKKENPLSALTGADKIRATISDIKERYKDLQVLMSEGTKNKFNTSMLDDNLVALKNRLIELNRVLNKDTSRMSDTKYMRGLYSNVAADMTLAKNAMAEYNRERDKMIASERAWQKETKSGFRGGRYLMPGNAETAQGYRDIAKAYQTAADTLQVKHKETEQKVSKQIDDYQREIKAIEEKVKSISPKMDGLTFNGKPLSAKDKASFDEYMRQIEHIKNTKGADADLALFNYDREEQKLKHLITMVQEYLQLADKVVQSTYRPYDSNSYEQKRISETAALKNAIIERAKAEEKAEKDRKKNEAEAKRDAEKAAQAEKQRQSEIEITKKRIQSLTYAMEKLQSKVSEGQSLKVDTTRAEAKVKELETEIQTLMLMLKNLEGTGWKAYLGDVGQYGNGRSTREANHLAQEQATANREAQKGVEIEQKRQAEIAKSAAKARNDLAAAFAGANAEAKKMQSIVSDIKSLFLQGGLVFGAQQFFNSIVQTGGEIVQQHVALRSILGDVQKADELFSQTQQLALQSPFKFGELNRDVKQLAAFGVEANDLYDTTKRLADIASGLGVSFERLGLAYGQVKARSWLDGKELRQFAYAGLPLLQKITELYNQEGKNGRNNYTQADVKKMISGRQVSFEDVQKVLWNMTNEGGQFYNMQLVLSETLLGRWNKLIDAWDIMLGKFAEGKNVVGGTFSFIINRVTDLVLALDKLSPALLSFGAVFAARKLGGMAYAKMGIGSLSKNYTQQMNAQFKSYAIEQQQLVVEGKITQQIAQQNVFKRAAALSDKQSLIASYNRAALEGRMSVLQMQRAVKEELVSKEIIRQLALMGQITAKQEQIILNGGRMSAMWSMATTKVGGFINALGGWWGIAITAVTSLFMGYSQWSSRVKEEEKTLIEGAKQKSKSYGDFLSGLGPKDTSNLSSQVDSMKEVLKSSDDYTDSIKQQVENAGSLSEQYDILKKKIENVKNVNDGFAEKYGAITNNATAATGLVNDNLFNMLGMDTPTWLQWLNGLTNDDISKNVEEAQESLSKFQVMFDELDSSTRTKMENFIQSLMKNNEKLANQIKGLPLAEQIRMLAAIGGDDWDKFVNKFASGSEETKKWLKELAERAKDSSDDVSEIMYDDVPKGLESIRKQLGMSQDNFKEWAKQNPEIFASMMDKMAQKANITSKTILYYFHSAISKLMDTNFWPDDDNTNKKAKPVYHSGVNTPFSEIIRQRLFKNKTVTGTKKKGKFWAREVDNALRQVQDQSFETTGENIRKELKSAKNELDTIVNGKVSKNSSEYKNAKHKYDLWKSIADAGYISDDLGKNKVTGNFGKDKNENGRQEDTELKSLQERLSSLKSARQMYKKYQSIMTDDAAKEKILKLFPEVTGLNLNDYQEAVRALLKGFKINTTERKKFQTSVYREVAEWIFDEKDKKAFEEKAATFSEEMNRLASQWDLYKELLQKTGSDSFSKNAFNDNGFLIDDKAKELMAVYKDNYSADFQTSGLMHLTDGEAKKTLKGPGQYEAWKKIVDLLRGNYIKSLQDAADIIEKTEGYIDKIVKIRDKYNDLIDKADDPGIKARYRQQKNKEIGAVKMDEFKGSSDYLNFYGAITSLGTEKAQAIGAKIRQYINEALQSGAIDAREYSKEIKQLEEQLSKLTQPRKTFLNGGLKGMAEQKIADANEQFTLATSKISDGLKTKALGEQLGDENVVKRGESMIASGKAMQDAALVLFKDGTTAKETLDKFAGVVGVIDQNVQGMCEAFNDIKETASLLGVDTDSDGWQDASAFFESFSGMSSSISKVVTSAESGNVGGILSGVTGIFTSPIKAFAKAHDNKLDRQIKIAERQLTELKNLSTNIKSSIEATLGGIYSYTRDDKTANKLKDVRDDYNKYQAIADSKFGKRFLGGQNISHYSKDTYDAVLKTDTNASAYQDQLALLHAQEDELRKQRASEADKKKSDKDKIADYDQQITEMEQQIKTFAQDFLKDIYSIDMKSWASELTDAVVSAWEKGEDAVDAYREKVKDMVKDVTKNIVTQKIMEKALSKPLDYLTGILDEKGKLDETDMDELADQLYKVGDEVVPQITGVFEALKNRGWDMRENGSSSTTNSVKSITEETADILAAYLQAIRLDVSVNRDEIKRISDAVRSVPELNVIARSQLTAMNQLVTLAEYRNSKLDDMYSWMRSITKETGARSLRIN